MQPQGYAYPPPPQPPYTPGPRRLRRSSANRRLGGVAGGLAEYLGIDATVLRVAFVFVSVLFLAGIGGIVLYLFAWALVPEEPRWYGPYPPQGPYVEQGPYGGQVPYGAQGQYPGPGRYGAPGPGPYDDAYTGGCGPFAGHHHRRGYGRPYYQQGPPTAQPGQPMGQPRPDQGPPPAGGVFGGRPWHDWDTGARSWALVLGAATLALIWYVGLGRGVHWPAWVVVTVLAMLLVSRRRARRWGQAGPPWVQPSPGPQGFPAGPAPSPGAAPTGGAGPATGPLPYIGEPAGAPPAGPESTATPTDSPPSGARGPEPVPDGAAPFGAAASSRPTSQEEADWAEARSAAAGWAASQLAAAGLPADSGTAGAHAGPLPVPPAQRRRRRTPALMLALCMALLLACVLSAVGVTVGSGASLGGGIGATSYAPASAAQLQSNYHLGVGRLDLDLSALRSLPTKRTVHVSVGLGRLQVEVPSGIPVAVTAHTGVGRTQVFVGSSAHPRLSIIADVGVGDIFVGPATAFIVPATSGAGSVVPAPGMARLEFPPMPGSAPKP